MHMQSRGFSTQLILGAIAAIIFIAALGVSSWKLSVSEPEPTATTSSPEKQAEGTTATSGAETEETKKPKPVTSLPTKLPPTPSPIPTTPPATTPPAETAPEIPATSTETGTTPNPVAWSPNFQASTRIAPGIPSEDERATLPSCDGLTFKPNFINLAEVQGITETSSEGAGGVVDLLTLNFSTKGVDFKYGLTAPGDVYVTHMKTEFDASPDGYDTTIYFALCRDVYGYFTNIKELSTSMQRLLGESACAVKPHTGPNACYTKFLSQISTGSALGNVGFVGGSFGFGVIDLRSQRTLANPAEHSIATNYSRCPFGYLSDASSLKQKTGSGGGVLCPFQ